MSELEDLLAVMMHGRQTDADMPLEMRLAIAEEEAGGPLEPRGRHRPRPSEARAAAAALPAERAGSGSDLDLPGRLDWKAAWAAVQADPAWLVEPLIPADGRAILIIAQPKSMKSLLALWLALAVGSGRPVLDEAPARPRRVLYLDAEMSEADVVERAASMGYGSPDGELLDAHLLYLLGPRPSLDTVEGAAQLLDIVRRWQPELVVFDTWRRLNSGEENDSGAVNAFYTGVIAPLKDWGVPSITLHHAGKDAWRGARGSSDFSGWPDVVYDLQLTDGGLAVKATHSRVPWIPRETVLQLRADPTGFDLGHRDWPAGTKELSDTLDSLGLPVTMGRELARRALTAAGLTARTEVLAAAIRFRKSTVRNVGTMPGTGV